MTSTDNTIQGICKAIDENPSDRFLMQVLLDAFIEEGKNRDHGLRWMIGCNIFPTQKPWNDGEVDEWRDKVRWFWLSDDICGFDSIHAVVDECVFEKLIGKEYSRHRRAFFTPSEAILELCRVFYDATR